MNSYRIETPVLRIALIGGYSEKETEFKKFIKDYHKSPPSLGYSLDISDFQMSSGIDKLGRRLLTYLVKGAFSITRSELYGDTYCFEQAINAFANTYRDDINNAIDELRYIATETRTVILNQQKNQLTLERLAPNHEADIFNIQGEGKLSYKYRPNIITSHCDKIGNNDWSGQQTWKHRIKLIRDIPVDDIITHPFHFPIENFIGEDEVLVINRSIEMEIDGNNVIWL
ncbi:hypothetical protein EDM56_02000 [Brevibacillus fluminis]|uniref:Uncharacterized protein n=1 Tax=Brevibacillus fluminis TaxID=511487 RepID=A0A3M8DWD7_9BACL|nr:hypothetical protein [Brevibacillus fluminis]RNB92490.1 hypothetical protein EDM56_02000 [Brevibacillus fluminis]